MGARTKFRNDDFCIYNHDCFYYYIRCLYFLFITFHELPTYFREAFILIHIFKNQDNLISFLSSFESNYVVFLKMLDTSLFFNGQMMIKYKYTLISFFLIFIVDWEASRVECKVIQGSQQLNVS